MSHVEEKFFVDLFAGNGALFCGPSATPSRRHWILKEAGWGATTKKFTLSPVIHSKQLPAETAAACAVRSCGEGNETLKTPQGANL
jgi:hypothetical protein